MSETPSPAPTPTPTPANPALTTPPQPNPSPAPTPTPEAPKSIIGGSAAPEWKEYVPDPAKSDEENAAAKTAHDATKPPAPEPVKPPAAAELTPIDFSKDVKLPEGFTVNETQSKEFTDIVNDHSLSRAQMAQKLVDLQAKSITELTTALSEKGKTDWDKVQTDWRKQCQQDPVIGGDKLPATEAAIGRLLDTFGDREARAAFDLTGAGNHPAIVRMLTKIGAKLNEPAPPPPPNPGNTEADAARKMFPTMKA